MLEEEELGALSRQRFRHDDAVQRDGLYACQWRGDTDGSVTSTSYSGNSSWRSDPIGAARETWVDGLGRVNQVEEDPNNLQYVTTYTHNALVRCVNGGDNASNLSTRTDNRNITTTYNYDALNRPTSITYSDGTSGATFGYDAGGAAAHAIGQLTSVSNGNSVTSFPNFDGVGRVISSLLV